MSIDPTHQEPQAAPPPARRRRPVVLVSVAVAGLLVGAIVATGVLLLSGRFGQPRHRYEVTVLLVHEITAEQRAAVESALRDRHPVDGVRFETRDEAYRKIRESLKDSPDLLRDIKPEHMPESFHLATTGTEFDCPAFAPVRRLPGVDDVLVIQAPADGRPGAKIACTF